MGFALTTLQSLRLSWSWKLLAFEQLLQTLKMHPHRPYWPFFLSQPFQYTSLSFLVILRSSLAILFAKSYSIFLSRIVFLACFHWSQSQDHFQLQCSWRTGTLIRTQWGWPRAQVRVRIQPMLPLKPVNVWYATCGYFPVFTDVQYCVVCKDWRV